jgi:hypothetical protein
MKSHRIIIYIGVVLAAALAVLPASALASSLLSGYGGPGQGSQAILGSALVNGPKGGGSGGGGGPAATSSGTAQNAGSSTGPVTQATPSAPSGSSGTSSAPSGRSKSSARGSQRARTRAHETAAGTTSGEQSFYPAAERVPSGVGGATLGLSGADLVYIILAAGILVSLGLLAWRTDAGDRREGASS